jgi:sigma-B regulation protein RsbU (phosphoserine phosphatase)
MGDWASPTQMAELGRDLETARDIQRRLLPRALPSLAGIEIGVALEPSKIIGGDFYDFVPMPGGVGLVVGDVSGKGIAAALLMVMTRTLFRAAAWEEDEAGTILERVNRALCRDLPPTMFVTMVLGILSLGAGRRLSVANAGHVPPLLLRRGRAPRRLEMGGPMLGVMERPTFDVEQVRLTAGDVIVICTDGLIENPGGPGLEDGLQALATRVDAARDAPPGIIASALLDEARTRQGGGRRDDATLLVLKA